MPSETFTVRVNADIKKRLAKLAESTGRSRSFLTAEAITEYLDTNEWQVAGIKAALVSVDQEGTIAHEDVEAWINSWGARSELTRRSPRDHEGPLVASRGGGLAGTSRLYP